jgi:hypothetical protein
MREIYKTYLRIFLQIKYQNPVPGLTTKTQLLSQGKMAGLQEHRRKFG